MRIPFHGKKIKHGSITGRHMIDYILYLFSIVASGEIIKSAFCHMQGPVFFNQHRLVPGEKANTFIDHNCIDPFEQAALSPVFKLVNVVKDADKRISEHFLSVMAVHHVAACKSEYWHIQVLKELFLSPPLMLFALIY